MVLVFGSGILALMASLPLPPMPLFVLLFLLVPAVMPLAGLYCLANSLRVEASSQGLITTREVFGIPCMRRRASIGEIIKISHRAIPGHYQLAAHLRDGREIIVGDGIPWSLAEHLQRRLQEVLKLKQP
jgi:hypothetical protein